MCVISGETNNVNNRCTELQYAHEIAHEVSKSTRLIISCSSIRQASLSAVCSYHTVTHPALIVNSAPLKTSRASTKFYFETSFWSIKRFDAKANALAGMLHFGRSRINHQQLTGWFTPRVSGHQHKRVDLGIVLFVSFRWPWMKVKREGTKKTGRNSNGLNSILLIKADFYMHR